MRRAANRAGMSDVIPPILREFPDTFETERLVIRCPRPGDGEAVNRAIVRSLERLQPWFPWAGHTPTVAETEENLRRAQVRFWERSDLRLLLFLKDGPTALAGSSGLHRINWTVPKFEIGYWATTGFEGKGYITEAVNGIAAFAFDTLGAARVEIRCDAVNARSVAVARRCGFEPEAHLHNDTRDVSGALRDTLIFARVRAID